MDRQTYLALLITGQAALILLDLVERGRSLRDGRQVASLKPGSVLFLIGIIIVYGVMQYGGLALIPTMDELVVALRPAAAGSQPGLEMTGALVVLTGVAVFYFAGLCDYLVHRFVSHSWLFWFSHENHHLTKDVSAFVPGLCVRPFAVIVVLPSAVVVIAVLQASLGAIGAQGWDPMPMIYVVVMIQAAVLGITHSAYLRHRSWLHPLLRPLGITSPQEHWLHHTSDLSGNFGNVTIVWDRVFGTYLDPDKIDPGAHRTGLAYDQDFLGAITLGRLKLPDWVRERFQLDQFCYFGRADSAPDVELRNPIRS